jgi:hypothetical protein
MSKDFVSKEARQFLSAGYHQVPGWLNYRVLQMLDCCVCIMREHDHAWEHTLEIGVHEGKFFIPLERVTPDHKDACAIDVFDLQMFNIDRSGAGNLERFQTNVAQYCRLPSRVKVVQGDSFDIHQGDLAQRRYSLISVDGGHTVQHVLSDMGFAAAALQPGGVIVLDDFPNFNWLGVIEGITLFMHGHGARLAPFATGFNKLFLTTVSYHKLYSDALRKQAGTYGLELTRPTSFCNWNVHVLASKTTPEKSE